MVRVLTVVVLAGVLIGVLVVVARALTGVAFGVTPSVPAPPIYLVINVLASMLAAGFGGYVCVRLVPDGRRTIAAALLFVVFLAAGYVMSRAVATPTEPLWFQALAVLLGASGLWCGVVVGASHHPRHG